MRLFRVAQAEPDATRAELVAELAHSAVPTGIMACTLVGIAILAYVSTGSPVLPAAAASCALAAAAKIWLMRRHAHRNLQGASTPGETRRWERAHAFLTLAMAASVGATAFDLFAGPDLRLQMLAAGLIFGYGSGIVSRVAIRPRIAIPALVVSSVPAILIAFLSGDAATSVLAATFTVFLLGSFDSVRHAHRTATRHVAIRLEMASLARVDPLTGLLNRLGLREAFSALPASRPVGMFFLDLDGFKPVNDRFGHAVGDVVLRSVSGRLSATVSPDATVARLGGDEFVVMQPGIRGEVQAAALATRLALAIREPIVVDEHRVSIGASVGYALDGERSAGLENLIASADEASYRVKNAGRTQASTGGRAATLRVVA